MLIAAVSCSNESVSDVKFEYRGLYTPTNADAAFRKAMKTHHVDYDWGLWGHNLKKLFRGGVPEEAQALVNGKRIAEQFCFSSEKLYRAVERYVEDNYGEGTKNVDEMAHFAILPNDNALVCQCEACRASGNTASSATPAVTAMVNRLAKRFPHHLFFTSAYATTATPPAKKQPANVGVLVSTIDLPLTAKTEKLEQRLAPWCDKVERIYVWDYMRNFDDYLTPYPCLLLLQKRLQTYRDAGVKGVFLNGSGDDYASLDDVQSYVLARLLSDPDINVMATADTALKQFYPTTHTVLRDFIEAIESRAVDSHKSVGPYMGIEDEAKAFLSADEFIGFCTRLDRLSKRTTGDERQRLNRLLTALNFSRLELRRAGLAPYDGEAVAEELIDLAGHSAFADMKHYREALGDLDDYIKTWREEPPRLTLEGNGLLGQRLTVRGADENARSTVLTDGRRAFASDYHTGWLLASRKTLCVTLPAELVNAKNLDFTVGFLCADRWHMVLPVAIEVWQGERQLLRKEKPFAGQNEGKNLDETANFSRITLSLHVTGVTAGDPLELRFLRPDSGRATIACDEIEMR